MSMTVREFTEWLLKFEDQDAIVEVPYEGSHREIDIKLDIDYVDFRGNAFVNPELPWYNKRFLQIGELT